ILPDEFGNAARRQAEQVVNDEHLPVAIRPGADANRWNFKRRGDLAGDWGGNAFQDHSKGPGLLSRGSVGVQPLGVALGSIAAHLMNVLRSQADVGHDGYAGADEAADDLRLFG